MHKIYKLYTLRGSADPFKSARGQGGREAGGQGAGGNAETNDPPGAPKCAISPS